MTQNKNKNIIYFNANNMYGYAMVRIKAKKNALRI